MYLQSVESAMCGESDETISYIVSECKKLAQKHEAQQVGLRKVQSTCNLCAITDFQ